MAKVLEEKTESEGQVKPRVPEEDSTYVYGSENPDVKKYIELYGTRGASLKELRNAWLWASEMGIVLPFPMNARDYEI